MKNFRNQIAVVTGGGSGMGRDLCLQLAAEGCHISLSDISTDTAAETRDMATAIAPTGTRVTSHGCDVSDEASVSAWRDAVAAEHETDHVNLVFNNAGIGGGGAFVDGSRDDWERTFGVCWYGVYYCSRAFMPMLVASDEGHIVNTSSINGFWASIGPHRSHTAYSAAKFAVKGFTEALVTDLRLNAPHVKASVVMPGHIGTGIALNSTQVLGHEVSAYVTEMAAEFRNSAPTSSEQAATIILDGVRDDRWRILVGDDAHVIDSMVRDHPEEVYEQSFLQRLVEQNAMAGVVNRQRGNTSFGHEND